MAGAEQGDRPIGAEHHALRAECFINRFKVGAQQFKIPGFSVHFGEHAGNLAVDVFALGQLADAGCPVGVEVSRNDAWLGDVIDDERLVWMHVHKLDRLRQVFPENQEIVSEIVFREVADACVEVGAEDEIIVRLVMDDMAHAAKFRMRGVAFQKWFAAILAERDPADHGLDAWIGIGGG